MPEPPDLPAGLREVAVREPAVAEWATGLADEVRRLSAQWGLTVHAPYEPGGHCSWTAPAADSQGRAVVLKLGWPHPEALHEADGLRFWDGDGTVRLLASDLTGPTSALLLEPLGAPLSTLAEPDQDVVIADLLRRLHQRPPAGHPFRPLREMCDMWTATAERCSPLAPRLVRRGTALFRELAAPAPTDVLLHTDLHAGNVLAGQREPWLAIDPKPYLGDPAYDVLQHLLNGTRLLQDPHALVRRMACLLDLDPHRLERWLFARCVIESGEQPELAHLAERLAPDLA